jgi:hypothetical protein
MVAAAENWAEIEGRVVSVEKHDELDGYVRVRIDVRSVTPVEGYANLFAWALGKQIDINIPQAAAESLAPGTTVHLRARKATPSASFADPESVQIP